MRSHFLSPCFYQGKSYGLYRNAEESFFFVPIAERRSNKGKERKMKFCSFLGPVRVASALPLVWFALMISATFPAYAGLRILEPSDYEAQDALLLHLDGIRNAGASEPHSYTATSWVNLADADCPAVFTFGSDDSRWDSDGFYFGGLTLARLVKTTTLGKAATIEVVCDIDTNALISAYVSGNYRQWPHIIGAEDTGDKFDLFYHTTASPKALYLKRAANTSFSLANWDGRYAVGAIDETRQVLVQDAAPNAATWGNTGTTGDIGTHTLLVGSANVAASNGQNLRFLTGKIKALRLYNRVLTDAEVAANRAIDEARFFGNIPVTNAVVATSLAGAEGADASGAYAVDDNGYTFRASSYATVGDTTYACIGCTVETSSDGGATWDAPVELDGCYAVEVASTDCKRITWRWAAASGAIGGETSGYVQDGLELHFDGVRNVGATAAHDASATAWIDLSGNGRHGHLSGNADGSSVWEGDGFRFNSNAVFNTEATFTLGKSFTAETILDVAKTDANRNLQILTMATVDGNSQHCYLYFHNGSSGFRFRSQAGTGVLWADEPTVAFTADRATYVAAFRDGDSNPDAARAAIVSGAAFYPTTWKTGSANVASAAEIWRFGAARNAFSIGDHPMKGAIKSVRLYSRLLTEAECAWNRAIDEYRFFGKDAPVSNAVIVASSIAGLEGREPDGLYFADGWTFAASSGTNVFNRLGWRCTGCQVQARDETTGTWGSAVTVTGAEWTAPAAPFVSRRLVWLWEPVRGARTAADFAVRGVSEYVKGGLALHFDGVRNVGATAAHDASATAWIDLSGNGRHGHLSGNADGSSVWEGDGFRFNSNAVFNTEATFTLGKSFTAETILDVAKTDANRNLQILTMATVDGNSQHCYLYFHNGSSGFRFRSQAGTGVLWADEPTVAFTADRATYVAAFRDGDSNPDAARAAIVSGAAFYPTTWKTGSANVASAAEIWRFGAARNAFSIGDHPMKGAIKSVRLYSRLLTEGECAWNRTVDEARFFGQLSTTNVIVEAAGVGAEQAESGAYQVFGSHTFTARTAVDAYGAVKPAVRYILEEFVDWDWTNQREIYGNSFTYNEGDYDHPVRITWKTYPEVLYIIVR